MRMKYMKSNFKEKRHKIRPYLNSGSKKLDVVSKQVIKSRKTKIKHGFNNTCLLFL